MNQMTVDGVGDGAAGALPDLGTLRLPEDAPARLRARLGLPLGAVPRIAFVAGPGDIVGSWRHWIEGRHDPRVPVVTYAAMFFELISRLEARAQIVAQQPSAGAGNPRVRFDEVNRAPWSTRGEYLRTTADYAARVRAAVQEFDPHVVIVGIDHPPAGWAALGRGRRLIATLHNTFWPMGQPARSPKSLLRRARLAWQLRSVDDAVCTSDECARQLAALTGGRVRGLVERPQMLARYPLKALDRVRNLLFLGRIEANKGVFLLLDAFCALQRTHPQLQLTFCGFGSAEAELAARISVEAPGAARFLGRVDAEGVHAQIDAADLVVCPTTSGFNEGLALVGFEAAAHGVPTVMSSVVPARDLLAGGCAVFAADDPVALEAVLRRLVEDSAAYRRLGDGLAEVREALHDRGQSWGSQLGRVLLR